MHDADFAEGLWEETDWREMRSSDGLDHVILDVVAKHPGATRKLLWYRVVQEHFMRYLEKEYRLMVQLLIDQHKLTSPTSRKTKKLNDDCQLYLT